MKKASFKFKLIAVFALAFVLLLCVGLIGCGNKSNQSSSENLSNGECAHVVVSLEGVAPTCISVGLTAGEKCSVCGEVLIAQEQIGKLSHTFSTQYSNNQTEHWFECSCGEKSNIVSHEYTWKTILEATNDTNGFKKGVCICGYEQIEVISAFNHSHDYKAIVTNPTCEEQGYTTHLCECGDFYIDSQVDATGHEYNEQLYDSYRVYTCNNCGNSYREALDGSASLAYSVNSNNTTCTITGVGECEDAVIVIPENLLGYKVTAIGEKAFENQTQITGISIPSSVTLIGTRAFYGCTGLTEITIPSSVTSIGTQIFYKSSVCTVYYNSTYSSESNQFLSIASIKKVVFGSKYVPSYILQNNANVTHVEIGDSVTSIASVAFRYCNSLTSVVIGNSVTSIGYSAFESCYKLVEVINHSSLNITAGKSSFGYVGYYAKEVHTGTSKIINKDNFLFYTFEGVNYLLGYVGVHNVTSLVLPNNYNGESYGIYDYAFYKCTSLTSVEIGDSVISIGDSVFYNCDSLTSVEIPDSVTSIGDSAFEDCYSLTSVEIGDSVTSIGDSAFYLCTSLTSVVIGDSVTSIGAGAFYKCYSLTSVVIGDSVTSIGDYAFHECYKLVEVINHSSLNITAGKSSFGYVGYYAKEVHRGTSKIVNKDNFLFYTFKGVNYLLGYVGVHNATSLVLPNNYNGESYGIYDYAFRYCDSLTSVEIPDSVTSIGRGAFSVTAYYNDESNWENGVLYICKYLIAAKEDIVGEYIIKEGTLCIADYAFSGCTSLTSVVIPDSVTSIGEMAFAYCFSLTSVVIPDSVTSIGNYAFYECYGLTSVIIPDSVTSIGDDAFAYCDSLTIYCEAESEPSGWSSKWNNSSRPVVWGHKGS